MLYWGFPGHLTASCPASRISGMPLPSGAARAVLALLLALATGFPWAGTWAASAGDPALVSQALRDDTIHLRAARIDPAAEPWSVPAASSAATPRYWIVQVRGPVGRRSRVMLQDAGGDVLRYLPNRAYLVRAGRDAAARIAADPQVTWMGPYRAAYRVDLDIGRVAWTDPRRPADDGEQLLVVSLFPGEDPDSLWAGAAATGAVLRSVDRDPDAPRWFVRAAEGTARALAGIEGVEWVEELGQITLRNETTRWVAQSNVVVETPVWDAGLHGEGQVIGHIDGPIRMDSCYFLDPVDNTPGPAHRKVVAYRGPLSSDPHGTHTAGSAAGWNAGGSLANAGLAYAARLSHTRSVLVSGYLDAPSNLYGYLALAHDDGARVHTNSWGDDTRTSYTWWCVDIDRFSRDHEEDLVLFAVTNMSTLRTPENAKNALAVGATEQAPNQENHGSGGQGPTADGRRKPELYLPGVGIVSAGTGSCDTSTMSGTSMACPAVAGAAALVRQYYVDGFYPTGLATPADALVPTGALLKATLLNGARDMTGVFGYPSAQEGWGRLLLDDALYFAGDTDGIVVRDVRNFVGLSTGEADEVQVLARDGSAFAVTLVFTDPPAAHAAVFATVNDLDLEVSGPDGVFRGNAFAGGVPVHGGAADNVNNVERVVFPAGSFTPGGWIVRVAGTNVPDGPQGYALHIAGEVSEAVAVGAAVREGPSPGATILAQNHPNPFARGTSISFALARRGHVLLDVYDISGRHVRTLSQGVLGEGAYTVPWDGRDAGGEEVAGGIYFYRLQAGGIDETRKMVVLR
jgi:subtilisin family serine protease